MELCDTPDNLTMLSYLTQLYDVFRGEIPFSHQKKTVIIHANITESFVQFIFIERKIIIRGSYLRKNRPFGDLFCVQDDDSFANVCSTATMTKTITYKNAWNKMNQTQKLSLMSRLANSIPRKRYRESRSPTVTCKSYDAQVPRKPKKRKSASTAGCSLVSTFPLILINRATIVVYIRRSEKKRNISLHRIGRSTLSRGCVYRVGTN